MRDELIRSLTEWEEGRIGADDLLARFPEENIGELLSLHSSLGAAAIDHGVDADQVWASIECRISQPSVGLYERALSSLRRPVVAITASALLTGGVAYAADIGPVRKGVDSVVRGIGDILGIERGGDGGDRQSQSAVTPEATAGPGDSDDLDAEARSADDGISGSETPGGDAPVTEAGADRTDPGTGVDPRVVDGTDGVSSGDNGPDDEPDDDGSGGGGSDDDSDDDSGGGGSDDGSDDDSDGGGSGDGSDDDSDDDSGDGGSGDGSDDDSDGGDSGGGSDDGSDGGEPDDGSDDGSDGGSSDDGSDDDASDEGSTDDGSDDGSDDGNEPDQPDEDEPDEDLFQSTG